MQQYKFYLLVIITSLSQTILGQAIIPFQLTASNNISIPAVLNKKDTVHLMFHTAASSLTLTEEAIQKITSLHFDGVDSVKSWGGSGNASRFSEGNSLQIGALEWTNVPIWENKNSGPATDGKFGTELFKNKVIEINFDTRTITISNRLPARAKKYDKLKLAFENDCMFLEAGCTIGDTTFKNRFLIHSGYAGAVLFDDKFAGESRIGEKVKITGENSLKDSFGNVLKTRKGILPALIIGKEKLPDVPAAFFEGAIGRQKMSIFGGDILKRFNIIIDAQREYIYLKASRLKGAAYTSV